MFVYVKVKIQEQNDTVYVVLLIELVSFGKLFPLKYESRFC